MIIFLRELIIIIIIIIIIIMIVNKFKSYDDGALFFTGFLGRGEL